MVTGIPPEKVVCQLLGMYNVDSTSIFLSIFPVFLSSRQSCLRGLEVLGPFRVMLCTLVAKIFDPRLLVLEYEVGQNGNDEIASNGRPNN